VHRLAWIVLLFLASSADATLPYVPPVHPWAVFFPFGKTTFSPYHNVSIEQVARIAEDFDADVLVDAAADAAEADPLALSQARGEAVKAALVKLGIPGDRVRITASGDSNLLVWTPRGIEEPQNRRADILIRNWRRAGTKTRDGDNMPYWYADNCAGKAGEDAGICGMFKPVYGKKR
jgi:hypothetical protein